MNVPSVTHVIQKEILRTLSYAEGLRFGQLKPATIESNLFLYHLRQLMKEKLVAHTDGLYFLTDKGQRYIAAVTRWKLEARQQPRLFSLLVLCNDQDEVVLYRRSRQPFINKYTFPGEVVYFDQTIDDQIEQLLSDKVQFQTPLRLRGLVDSRLSQDGQLITHIYAHILYGKVAGRPKVTAKDPRFAPPLWLNPNKLDEQQLLPDVLAVLAHLATADDYFYLPLQHEVQSS